MGTESLTARVQLSYPAAVDRLLEEFAWNPWFLTSYWPENEPRIRLVARRAQALAPARGRTLDVGCANGYVSYLFHLMGFHVTAVDAYDDERRAELFGRTGIDYTHANLNEPAPLAAFQPASYDLVLLGEVFEHILNRPLGVLEAIFQVLRPGGIFVLTTPNPSTVANAVRLLRDRYVLWGTTEFLEEAKLEGGRVISRADIHYREYQAWIVRNAIERAGFQVGGVKYVRAGTAPTHPLAKRVAKQLLRIVGLANARLFSPGYVIWARK